MSAFFEQLFSRQSIKFVQAPGPNEHQLDLILQAAMRAPDHGGIRPWRFKLIRGVDVKNIVDLAIQAGERSGKPMPDFKIQKWSKWLAQVPLAIAVASAADPNGRIRPIESQLSVGCAVMNMLNAAHALGLGAFWSTGMGTYMDWVPEALGFDVLDETFMGYLVIGTPIDQVQPKERPDYQDFVSEWHPG